MKIRLNSDSLEEIVMPRYFVLPVVTIGHPIMVEWLIYSSL